jgi:predicted Na+-dependent transporter
MYFVFGTSISVVLKFWVDAVGLMSLIGFIFSTCHSLSFGFDLGLVFVSVCRSGIMAILVLIAWSFGHCLTSVDFDASNSLVSPASRVLPPFLSGLICLSDVVLNADSEYVICFMAALFWLSRNFEMSML